MTLQGKALTHYIKSHYIIYQFTARNEQLSTLTSYSSSAWAENWYMLHVIYDMLFNFKHQLLNWLLQGAKDMSRRG